MKPLFDLPKKKRRKSKPEEWFETQFGALFSDCEQYRYLLWRRWDRSKPYMMMLMLNPSTATETKNDPTVAKCQKWARQWGYGGIVVCNIFAYRSTDPKGMKAVEDPIGRSNDRYIKTALKRAGLVICAWGNHGKHRGRSDDIRNMLRGLGIKPKCLKISETTGEPYHPLYLANDTIPFEFDLKIRKKK